MAEILEKFFKGGLDECAPQVWSQRAFWLLAGTIYQRLAVDQEALETPELVALAKALAENRRAEGRTLVGVPGDAPRSPAVIPAHTPPQSRLEDLVRELYGLSPSSLSAGEARAAGSDATDSPVAPARRH